MPLKLPLLAVVTSALLLSLSVPAGVNAQQRSASAPVAAPSTGYDAVGVVKEADPAAGKVTIAHEAIAGLGWPAMTMTFTVKDRALFEKLAVDRKVEFAVAKQGAAYVVTRVN